MTDPLQRVKARTAQVLELVKRESQQLVAVRERFFADTSTDQVTEQWLEHKLSTPEGVDQLESFGSKFSRMQDTIMDKLLPLYLESVGERTGPVIDNLNRAERLTLIDHANEWLEMRRLRNQLVHEYQPALSEMASTLRRAKDLTDSLTSTVERIREQVELL